MSEEKNHHRRAFYFKIERVGKPSQQYAPKITDKLFGKSRAAVARWRARQNKSVEIRGPVQWQQLHTRQMFREHLRPVQDESGDDNSQAASQAAAELFQRDYRIRRLQMRG